MIRDAYRVNVEKNPRCDQPPMIPVRQWGALQEDTKEKGMRKQGRTPPDGGRYNICNLT